MLYPKADRFLLIGWLRQERDALARDWNSIVGKTDNYTKQHFDHDLKVGMQANVHSH
jgi:hypothetical protein